MEKKLENNYIVVLHVNFLAEYSEYETDKYLKKQQAFPRLILNARKKISTVRHELADLKINFDSK